MILRSRRFQLWMARLALAAVLLVSVMPTVSRWLESRAPAWQTAVLAMCTMDGLAMQPASLLDDTGKAPAPAGAMPDEYCAYCPLLAALAPLALAVLAILLPALPRALLPAWVPPASPVPPLLRGLGARGPPILL
jgi:hypothetical protein